MFKKIVWATDGSDAADAALPVASALAKQHEARLVVVHSVQHMVGPYVAGYTVELREEELQAKIAAQISRLVDEGVDATSVMISGNTLKGAAQDIARAAAQENADLIVVGTHGHTALGDVLLGSVTRRLLHISTCPVLVVPTNIEARKAAIAADERVTA